MISLIHKIWIFLRKKYHTPGFSKIGFLSYLLYGYKGNISKSYIVDSLYKLTYYRYTHIGNEIFNGRLFEEKELSFLTKLLTVEPKPVLIDIGANIGLHTIFLCKNVSKLRAISIEPAPKTYSRLSANIDLNDLNGRVQLLNLALSDSSGVADFFETTDDAFSSLKDTGRMKVAQVTKVKIACLNEIPEINALTNITLVKIDVEGFENEVINGAINVLQKFKPDIFIEIYQGKNSNLNPTVTINKLLSLGYNAYIIDEEGNLKSFIEHSDLYQNHFFSFKKMIT